MNTIPSAKAELALPVLESGPLIPTLQTTVTPQRDLLVLPHLGIPTLDAEARRMVGVTHLACGVWRQQRRS